MHSTTIYLHATASPTLFHGMAAHASSQGCLHSIRSSIMQLLIRGRPCTFQSNMSIQFDDGAEITMLRRERPWVMLDTDNHPLFLVTGCETCKEPGRNCRSYTVLTPLLPLGRTPAS